MCPYYPLIIEDQDYLLIFFLFEHFAISASWGEENGLKDARLKQFRLLG
jgi:hypothetical protein